MAATSERAVRGISKYRSTTVIAGLSILLAAIVGAAVTLNPVVVIVAAMAVATLVIAAANLISLPMVTAFGTALALGLVPGASPFRLLAAGVDVVDVGIAVVVISFLALAWRNGTAARGIPQPHKGVVIWAGCLIGWWIVTLAASIYGSPPMPISEAARTGRDFLYFGVLLIIGGPALANEKDRRQLAALLAGLCAYAAVTQIPTSLGLSIFAPLVHSHHELFVGGLTRIYPLTGDFLAAGALFATGYYLLHGGAHRRLVLLVATLAFVAHTLLLGRASTLGVLVAFSVCALVAFPRVAVRALVAAGVLVALAAGGAKLAPGSPYATAVTSVSERIASATADVEQRQSSDVSNSVGYRVRVATAMTNRLSREDGWITGLGFLSISTTYDPSLPGGSIRSPDFGYLNALMTMGLVGTFLVYAPVLAAAWSFLRRSRDRSNPEAWIGFGALAFCVYAIVVSPTLATLFSPIGVLITGLAIALGMGSQISRHRSTVG